MKFKVEKRYIKPPIKSIIDKAEEVIPYGYYCTGDGAKCSNVGGTECPFLQWRKMTSSRLKKFKKVFTNPKTGETKTYYDIPAGNTMLQYCSYLKDYLYIQDCIKDCRIKDYWPKEEEEMDEILYEATSDGLDEELRKKNDELIKKDIEEVAKNCFVVSVNDLSEEETKEFLEKIKQEIEKNPRYGDIEFIYNNPGPIENSIYINQNLNEDEVNEINKVISQIKIKEKYNLLATKYANKKEDE